MFIHPKHMHQGLTHPKHWKVSQNNQGAITMCMTCCTLQTEYQNYHKLTHQSQNYLDKWFALEGWSYKLHESRNSGTSKFQPQLLLQENNLRGIRPFIHQEHKQNENKELPWHFLQIIQLEWGKLFYFHTHIQTHPF